MSESNERLQSVNDCTQLIEQLTAALKRAEAAWSTVPPALEAVHDALDWVSMAKRAIDDINDDPLPANWELES